MAFTTSDPIARARELLARFGDASIDEWTTALSSPSALVRWAAAVAIVRWLGAGAPASAFESLADAYVEEPEETRLEQTAYSLFREHDLDLRALDALADRATASLLVRRLLARLDDLDPAQVARGERTRACEVLGLIVRLTFPASERVRDPVGMDALERDVLTTLAGDQVERWCRILWPPFWWYHGLPDRPPANHGCVAISRDEYWDQINRLRQGLPLPEVPQKNASRRRRRSELALRIGIARADGYLYTIRPPLGPTAAAEITAIPSTETESAGGEAMILAVLPLAEDFVYEIAGGDVIRTPCGPSGTMLTTT
jgi:hypothetical protein